MDREAGNINDILAGCRNDDRKAQEQLYRNYYRALMSLCLRYTKNEEDALEVLNTGFFKVFKNIHRFDAARASLYTWMRTIVINSCIDHIKSKQSGYRTGELEQAGEQPVAPEVIAKLNSNELLRLVRKLPPATQAVFNLYVTEGYAHKEIAVMLGISVGTSKWHLNEARKQLKEMIKTTIH